jgi:hypothetical protein
VREGVRGGGGWHSVLFLLILFDSFSVYRLPRCLHSFMNAMRDVVLEAVREYCLSLLISSGPQ